jgi:hypothetical protein
MLQRTNCLQPSKADPIHEKFILMFPLLGRRRWCRGVSWAQKCFSPCGNDFVFARITRSAAGLTNGSFLSNTKSFFIIFLSIDSRSCLDLNSVHEIIVKHEGEDSLLPLPNYKVKIVRSFTLAWRQSQRALVVGNRHRPCRTEMQDFRLFIRNFDLHDRDGEKGPREISRSEKKASLGMHFRLSI